MCVGSIAPVINPAGYALSKLPVPGIISDPAQAVAQKVVGKNVLTDPTYKTVNTPGAPSSASGTFIGNVPTTQDDSQRALAASALSNDSGGGAKKTALGQ